MKSIVPKIKTSYTFYLIDSATNKLKQKIEAHNEMCVNFWYYYSYYGGPYFALALGNEDDITKGYSWIRTDEARKRTHPKKNVLKFVFTFEAAADVVGEVKNFGMFHSCEHCMSNSAPFGRSISEVNTKGDLKDSEGNSITINKTALDKLIVEVEWEFLFTSNDFIWLEDSQNAIFACANALGYTSSIESACGLGAQLARSIFLSTLPIDKGILPISYNAFAGNSYTTKCISHAWGTRYSTNWKYSNKDPYKYTENDKLRIPQAYNPLRYINQIGIDGLGAISLPNTNVFPVYTIEGIDVGIGDGSTTDFECPIPWFLKDTDKLYKNGVVLTRDVDYTIDHKHNRQKCLSISEGNFAKVLQAPMQYIGKEKTITSSNVWGSPFIPFAACLDPCGEYASSYITDAIPYIVFKTDEPLILDMGKETEINYFVSPRIKGGNKLKLYYSNDNTMYTYVGEVSVLIEDVSAGTAIPDKYRLSFSTIKARYWKVEITTTGASVGTYECNNYSSSYADDQVEETKTKMYNQCGFLGYVGEPIKFKSPPAKGDIITMDVSLDRPYKTTQNVIDIAFKYTY